MASEKMNKTQSTKKRNLRFIAAFGVACTAAVVCVLVFVVFVGDKKSNQTTAADEKGTVGTKSLDVTLNQATSAPIAPFAPIAPPPVAPVTPTQPPKFEDPCEVCGEGKVITIPDNTVTFPGQPPFTCSDIELAGQEGFIDPVLCPSLPPFVDVPCGCDEGAPETLAPITEAPATPAPITEAPVTPAPTTPAPETSPPVTGEPTTPFPVTAAPFSSPPVTPADCTIVGDIIASKIFGGEEFDDPMSYQSRARAWAILDCEENNRAPSEISIQQRYVLACLYFANGGDDWIYKSNWLTGASECDWHGVECNSDAVVTGIYLRDNNLVGPLIPEVSILGDLVVISLAANTLSGSIPTQFVSLDVLRWMWLYSNELTGTIPTELGTINTLEVLELHKNVFTGTMPESICTIFDTSDYADKSLTVDCDEVSCDCCTQCF